MKYSGYLVEFKMQYEVYEKVKKEAKKRGFKSPGLYAKELVYASLKSNSQEEIKGDIITEINHLKDDIDQLWQTLERNQKQERQFRARVEETLTAILEQLQKPLPELSPGQSDSVAPSSQKRSPLPTENNPLDARYARSKR